MIQDTTKKILEKIPQTPGVYLMKDKRGKILYVGKAGNLSRRVRSYFERPHDSRIERMVNLIDGIETKETDTALEALMLESQLIKRYYPPYNVKEKDDKSFLYVVVTRGAAPQVKLMRGKELTEQEKARAFGPFVQSSQITVALKLLRKIFPFSTHNPHDIGTFKRPCLDAELGLCPGTCTGNFEKEKYRRDLRGLKQVLKGERQALVRRLERDMKTYAKRQEYEAAERAKRQLFALTHVNDIALISRDAAREEQTERIEGYDISNISGTSAVGVMVVFRNGKPSRSEYRKFRIRAFRTEAGGDVGMLKEVLARRLRHIPPQDNWPLPDTVLVDGGVAQVHAVQEVLAKHDISVPVVGIAKGPKRKKNEFIGRVPRGTSEETLIRVRDEAHRFAITYHRELRGRRSLE